MRGLCLIVWMIFTLVLTFSIIGMLLFVPDLDNDGHPSSWMQIGRNLLNAVVNEKANK